MIPQIIATIFISTLCLAALITVGRDWRVAVELRLKGLWFFCMTMFILVLTISLFAVWAK